MKPIKVPRYHRRSRFAKKWWCPSYMFDGKEYPKMVSGAAYAMTYGAAECLYRETMALPFFHLVQNMRKKPSFNLHFEFSSQSLY